MGVVFLVQFPEGAAAVFPAVQQKFPVIAYGERINTRFVCHADLEIIMGQLPFAFRKKIPVVRGAPDLIFPVRGSDGIKCDLRILEIACHAQNLVVVLCCQILFEQEFLTVFFRKQIVRKERKIFEIHRTFYGSGKHQQQRIDHGRRAQQQDQVDHHTQQDHFPVFPFHFTDDRHVISPIS